MHERASHAASRSGVGYSSRSPALLRSRLIAHARPPGRMSLFWRVFTANAALLVAAALVLGVSPVTVSWPIAVTEAVVLGLGLAGMLAANAVLLRLAFAPLTALATRMTQVDLLDQPDRLEAPGRGEIAALVETFNDMLARLEAERRDGTRRAVAAQEAERRRVATELHDEVGQTMTAVLMQLERLQEGVADQWRDELRGVQEAVRVTVGEVGRIAQELRPEVLDHLGLLSALAALSRGFTDRTGIAVDCRFDSHLPALDPDTELAVYRIVQESLTNVARHAGARHAELSLRHTPHHVQVEITDDGRGLPADTVAGAGLRGMRERAALSCGQITVDNRPAGGARVSLDLPANMPDP
jgi:two-component system, NarL family, sensor histidine kinase UhpB